MLIESRTAISRLGWERVGLLGLLALQILLALTLPIAGRLLIDEVVYAEMTRGLTSGQGFTFDNGYSEIASPELLTTHMRVTADGELTGQYPYGLSLLVAPLFALLGIRGIMLANAVALVPVVALTWWLARRLLKDRWIATCSTVVLLAATYLWEYSIAIWPHMIALGLSLGGLVAMLKATDGDSGKSIRNGAFSGLLFGLAVFCRFDSILFAPVLALTIYQRRPLAARTVPAFIVGTLPAVFALILSNYVRWGTLTPLTYGGSITDWLLPIVATGIALVAVVWGAVIGMKKLPNLHRSIKLLLGVAACAGLLVIPTTRRLAFDSLVGAWTLIVDLRRYPLVDTPGLQRLADGTLLYAGTVKKSLLQSLPYAPLIGLPLITQWRTEYRRAMLIFIAPVLAFVGFYSPRAWHGGLSFNLRYFLPLIPFVAILTAWSLKLAIDRFSPGLDLGRLGRRMAVATLAIFAAARLALPSIGGTAWLLSIPPLVIAACVAVAIAVLLVRTSRLAANVTLALGLTGLVWAGAVAFGYDTTATMSIRNAHASTSEAIAELIEDGSLLVVDWPDNTFGVKDHRHGVVIALPGNDDYVSWPDVLRYFSATRPVYGAMTAASWQELPDPTTGEWVEIGEVGTYSVRELSR